ncbi:MAG: hypothetical protein ABWZ57_05090 [Mesorhizobium sp.]
MQGYSERRTAALRELFEGATPSYERLAQACGRNARSLQRLASRDGWGERLAALSENERLARLGAFSDWIVHRLETVRRRAEPPGATIDREEVEAISVLMRTVERLGDVARSLDGAREGQARRDALKAGILKRIDQRILELAREFARQIAGQEDGAGAGADRPAGEAGRATT